MGDERRVDRIKVAKMIHKAATDKKEEKKAAAAAASAVTSSNQASHSSLSSSANEFAMLQHQRHLHNLQTYNLLATGRQLGLPGVSTSPRGLLGGGSSDVVVSSPTSSSSRYVGNALQGERAIAAMSLVSIERDIQYCFEMIGYHQERLAMLQTIKEMKLSFAAGMRRNSGMGSGGGYNMGSMSMNP